VLINEAFFKMKCEKRLLISSCRPSVRLSAWKNMTPSVALMLMSIAIGF